eukprot:11986770-Ditylum_brightwellii.AAC.1
MQIKRSIERGYDHMNVILTPMCNPGSDSGLAVLHTGLCTTCCWPHVEVCWTLFESKASTAALGVI